MPCQPVPAPDFEETLQPLFAPLTSLPGIASAQAALFKRAIGGTRVLDLLFHLPESYIDRRDRPTIRTARPGQIATLAVEVMRHEPPTTARQPFRAIVTDGSGFAELVFFGRGPWAQKAPVGAKLLVSGKLETYGNRRSIANPAHMVALDQADRLPDVEPIWGLTGGLFPWHVRRGMAGALARLPELPEWLDQKLLQKHGWPSFHAALRAMQAPAEPPPPQARARLAYDELLAGQIALAQVRARVRARAGRSRVGDGRLRATALTRFGHTPTKAQRQALDEIDSDLAAPTRMLRLLQGDVGSGKTLVALLAMLQVVESGGQAALMVPTEVLARQHHATFCRLCSAPVGLLSGSVKGAARRQVLAGLADGGLPIVIGTHALFQAGVVFRDLGLAVIDEQHRFGVDQRLLLGDKGTHTDILVMTATPIPRTLLLLQWGEMSVSRLADKPAGRGAIRTTLHSLATLADVVDAVARALASGAYIYWICPLVEESELIDLAAAEARHEQLQQRFGENVALAHGRQESTLRDTALGDFAAGRRRLLVATTVVEVGVDVSQATVMVIEHAERFGLAQLHQLRGRVGRGSAPSFCLLLHDDGLNEMARRRLLLLRDTDDGFLIADEDFRLRGAGEALGTRQAGMPELRLADPSLHEDLLHLANKDAALLLEKDPSLDSPRGQAIGVLLTLFGKTEPERTLLAG
jgi:ATP-dependent DNA helicase RecG